MVSTKSLRYLKELQPLGRDQVENLFSMASFQWRSQTILFWGDKMFDFRRGAVFFWDIASQSTQWLHILKIWGEPWPPVHPVYAYATILQDVNEWYLRKSEVSLKPACCQPRRTGRHFIGGGAEKICPDNNDLPWK